jgi:molecular chaperone GrpE (heat shock protein)
MEENNMGSQKKKEIMEKADAMPASEDKSTAEQLAELESQRRALLEKVKREKADAIQSRKDAKRHRNEILSLEKETVDKIQAEIFAYNRLGKQAKSEHKILARINEIISCVGMDSALADA